MARKVPGISGEGRRWHATAYDPSLGRKARVKNPITGKTTFATQTEAIAAKEHFELTKGTEASSKAWTAEAWVLEWTTNPAYARQSDTTNEHNAERVKKFAADFNDQPIAAITRKEAREWAHKNQGRLLSVRAMLNDAVKDGVIPTNPFANLGLEQSRGRKDNTPLTEDEVTRLAGIAYELFPAWPALGTLILTAAYTGMRLGELGGLMWEDVDWENGTIRVERQLRRDRSLVPPKNRRSRVIAMLDPVPAVLRELPRTSDFVFTAMRGGPYYSQAHTYYWSQVRVGFYKTLPADRAKRIGPNLDFHELRHFCGSYLADRGLSPMDIAFQLGHTDGGKLAQSLYIHAYEDRALERIRSAQLPVSRSASGQR